MVASAAVGLPEAVVIRAHNVASGMVDYKFEFEDLGLFPRAIKMINAADVVFEALVVNKPRAREELESDWTSTMNLAEWLLQAHDLLSCLIRAEQTTLRSRPNISGRFAASLYPTITRRRFSFSA